MNRPHGRTARRSAATRCRSGVCGGNRLGTGAAAQLAGLRTHILVSLGAAAFVLIALRTVPGGLANASAATQVDVSRVIQGIAGGIGFLGAGTIIQGRGKVEGLTTAASLWLAAALGFAAGTGELVLGVVMTVFALFVLAGLGALTAHTNGD